MRQSRGFEITPLWLVAILGIGLGLILLIVKSLQAGPEKETPPPAGHLTTASVTDEQLRKFALTFDEVTAIYEGLRDELVQMPDEDVAARAEQRAQEKVAGAIRDNGMAVEEYNRIARLLNENVELMARFQQIRRQVLP